MKNRKSDIVTVLLFCGFLGAMLLGYLTLPKQEYSEKEKRFLTEAPALAWEDIASGQWGEDAESYMADHIPGRDFFVGLNAYFDLYTGRQVSKDIWVIDNKLVEAPYAYNEGAVSMNMDAINRFAETVGQDVHLMIVPSAGWATGNENYRDTEIIDAIYAKAENVIPVDMRPTFAGNPGYYYDTDHHWDAAGAYVGYETLMNALNREVNPSSAFDKHHVDEPFRGSNYSRSCLWLMPGEPFVYWTGSENLTVTNGESDEVHVGVIYEARFTEGDKYTAFLDGNHSIVRIQNPDKEGKILVIRDSYSNSLGCFLAESYGEVVLVDLRYYKHPISQLCAEENFDDIVVGYCIGNFLTDNNLLWLK